MNSDIEKYWNKLKNQRDEMQVQAHLARAEFGDEWEEVEEKWQKAEQKFNRIQDHAVETTTEMRLSAKIIMGEIANTYDRIKVRLNN